MDELATARRHDRAAILIGALALGAMVVYVSSGIALLAPAVVGVLSLFALTIALVPAADGAARARIMRWTMVAFAAHLAFGLAVANLGGIVRDYLAAPDAGAYHAGAQALLQHWEGGFPAPDLPAGKEGYYYLLGALYRVFGVHPVAGLAVNATLAAALIPVVSDTTRRLFGRAPTRYVAPLVVLLPGIFLWTSQLLKEAAILLLIAVAANGAVRLCQRFSPAPLLAVTVALVLLLTLRAWVALALAGALLVGIAFGARGMVTGVGLGLSVVAVFAMLVAAGGLGYSGYRAATSSNLQQANAVRQDLATAGSGFDPDADVSTPARALSYLPRGLVQFTFGPFPWQISGARQLALVPDMLVIWLLLPSLWRGLRRGRPLVNRELLVLILPAIAVAMLLSLSVGNYGTQLRERTQVLVLVVPFVALGLSERAARRSRRAAPADAGLPMGRYPAQHDGVGSPPVPSASPHAAHAHS
ncbi:MAG TPA: hypothetical protein VG455_16020 [Acidimicrobiales bacterium]|nr:hypothetical protein [Acidimicrobiales bacterium]